MINQFLRRCYYGIRVKRRKELYAIRRDLYRRGLSAEALLWQLGEGERLSFEQRKEKRAIIATIEVIDEQTEY